MKENKYDQNSFFAEYSNMLRSVNGLQGAGEWHVFKKMIPHLSGKRVLNIGCGFGWHCRYSIEQGATRVAGVDLLKKIPGMQHELRRPMFLLIAADKITHHLVDAN